MKTNGRGRKVGHTVSRQNASPTEYGWKFRKSMKTTTRSCKGLRNENVERPLRFIMEMYDAETNVEEF